MIIVSSDMGLFNLLKGEKVLYYPGCVRNFVPQGRFAGGTLRWHPHRFKIIGWGRLWDASLVGRFAGGGLGEWRIEL